MAIIVEGEKRGPNILTVLGVLIVVGLVVFASYSLFFAPAPLVETIAPKDLETTSAISKIQLNVSVVTDSAVFQSLKKYIENPEIESSGRTNPFEPF